MSTNLFMVSKVLWAVTSPSDGEPRTFSTIESAAAYLEHLGIPDEEIDVALTEMTAHGHTRAQFSVTKGSFVFSDNAKLEEILGVA